MRRRFISNWSFQISFALALVRGIILGIVIPGLMALFTLYMMSQHVGISPDQKTVLVKGLNNLVVFFLWAAAMLGLLFGTAGLILSQRFVGPLYRIETWLVQHLMKNDSSPLRLRKNDELSSVAIILNRVVRKIETEKEIE